jgi:hypothetical protein
LTAGFFAGFAHAEAPFGEGWGRLKMQKEKISENFQIRRKRLI